MPSARREVSSPVASTGSVRMNLGAESPSLILFRLSAERQLALFQVVRTSGFRVNTVTELTDLVREMGRVEDAAVLIDLVQLSAAEAQILAVFLHSGRVKPWAVALIVPRTNAGDVGAWLEAGVNWIVGPDDSPAFLLQHLAKLRELALARLEVNLLRAVVAAVPNGITIADMRHSDQGLIFVNPGFEAITGYAADETIGRNCRFLQQGLLQQPATEDIRHALAEGTPLHTKLYNRRKDGALFVNELNLSPFRDSYGELTHFIGVQRDVTLRESAMQRLEASPIKVWQLDDRLRTEFVSSAWSDVLADPAALPPPDALRSLHPEDEAQIREAFDRALRTGRASGADGRLRLLSGEWRWHHFSVAPRTADDGQVFGLIGAAIDVHPFREAEAQANRRLQQLSLQSMLLRRLLSGTAIDPAAVAQALEIVAEVVAADEAVVVALPEGAEGVMVIRNRWSLSPRGGLAPALTGRRFHEVFPFSAARVFASDHAVGLEHSEVRRLAGDGGMLACPVRREGQLVGCLILAATAPAENWSKQGGEMLKAVGSLLHYLV